MDDKSETHMMNLMCNIRDKFSFLIKKIEEAGYEVIVTHSYRDPKTAKALYEKTKHQKGGRAAKNSRHMNRIAIDINLTKNGTWWKMGSPKADWEATGIPKLAKSLGFRWGGEFVGNYDPVHFDLGNDFTSNKLTGELESKKPAEMGTVLKCLVEDFTKKYFW